MRISGNTVLITGGGTGIGRALAQSFLQNNNVVIICGRREERLHQAQDALPGIHIRRCDVASAAQRLALFQWAAEHFGALNVLINNAGIQRGIDFRQGSADLMNGEDEIETNLRAPLHLAALFIPTLLMREQSAIINVTSGLGFIPSAAFPVYCATKAALHSFSWTLRHQLRGTSIRVFEIIPPMVRSEMNMTSRISRGQQHGGLDPQVVADATLQAMADDAYDVAVGDAQRLVLASRTEPEAAFRGMNGW
jgi:uncharacterized oxidoreductase